MARAPVKRRPTTPTQSSDLAASQSDGRKRVAIESVSPEIDAGRFPAKRALGEKVAVEADIFADGHDALACVTRYRHASSPSWTEVPMVPLVNDRWRAEFVVTELGTYRFTIEAWIDRFGTWSRQFAKRVEAGQDVTQELEVAARLVEAAAARAAAPDSEKLAGYAAQLRKGKAAAAAALGSDLAELMERHADRSLSATNGREVEVIVEAERARYGAWYEMFPRSAGKQGKHGTFRDVEDWLPYISGMGFDVLYLPPIHPIGRTHRKGANNSVKAKPDEPGSPWAIGSDEGGHKSVHPQLGTLDDFRRLVRVAGEHGLSIALDIAFQCSPDHPYAKEHPEWFRHRADGSIQYAENPPKKYEDIYPFDFETNDWRALWEELKSVFVFWVQQGVHIFRVDNPHTKPFRFWEWVIAEVKRDYPDVMFLSEAFTRPRLMERLAKSGFTQSYTYFAWKTKKTDIRDYFAQLTSAPLKDYFRPNAWPNTPDILTEYLATGGRPAFIVRLVLAATLSSSYGIYGPAFELVEHVPARPGSEEYLNSEKYELKRWDIERKDSLREIITRVNAIRHENQALQSNEGLSFHLADDENVICYSKRTADARNIVVTVVNLDPKRTHSAVIELPIEEWGIDPKRAFPIEELLTGSKSRWRGNMRELRLDPKTSPAAICRLSGKTAERQHASA